MIITSVESQYIQKSRLFLYPILGLKRGMGVTPIQTYMCWKNKFSFEDYKFFATYHMRADLEFKKFEEIFLLKNKYFEDWIQLEDDKGLYIFDYSEIKEDYDHIIDGKYSHLSDKHKTKVLKFFNNNRANYDKINSYLYPQNFYEAYAKLLKVPITLLMGVGQLCSIPDFFEETLKLKEKNINFGLNNNFNNTEL